ncbi:zinc finger protein 571-like [Arapaima gigas]
MLDRANVQNQSSMGDACSVVPGSVRKTNKGLVMDLKTGRCDFDFKKSVEFHSYLRSAECHHKERQDDTGESSLKDNTGPPDEKPSIALQMFTGHLADREETPMMQNTENLAEISGKATKPEKVSLRKESPLNLGADEFLSGDSCRLKVIMMEEVKEEKEDQKDSAIRESGVFSPQAVGRS